MRDPAEPLGQSRRSRDIDEQHEAAFLDRGMISPGDEVEECARPDDVGDSAGQIDHNRDHRGIDKPGPESVAGRFEGQPGDPLTQLQQLNGDGDRRIDRTAHHQIGRERKLAEPRPQRPFQHEQLDASEHAAQRKPVRNSHNHPSRRGATLRHVEDDTGHDPRDADPGQHSQFSFKPRVHAIRPGVAAAPTSSHAAFGAGRRVRMLSASFRGCAARCRHSMNVVSCAPSSATNTAISSAGSVLLALAETRCVASGGSKNDCPTLKVSTGPPPSCERISPLVI